MEADRVSRSSNKQWLQLDVEVERLEKLLSTEYYVYEHTGLGKATIAHTLRLERL